MVRRQANWRLVSAVYQVRHCNQNGSTNSLVQQDMTHLLLLPVSQHLHGRDEIAHVFGGLDVLGGEQVDQRFAMNRSTIEYCHYILVIKLDSPSVLLTMLPYHTDRG